MSSNPLSLLPSHSSFVLEVKEPFSRPHQHQHAHLHLHTLINTDILQTECFCMHTQEEGDYFGMWQTDRF